MESQTPQDYRRAFIKEFNAIAKHKHRYDVFRDFVTMAACSLHNSIRKDPAREDEYLQIIAGYGKEDSERFPKLLGYLIEMLEPQPQDILGSLYMELEISNKNAGQFFTPSSVSDFMAKILHGEELENLEKPFITLSEPACGAGGMVLSFVKAMIDAGHNPAEKLWTQCVDIDRLAALMCYVQLSLWNVPAEILVGDTLRWEFRERWHTPAYYLGNWQWKLAAHAPKPKEETGRSEQKQTRTETYTKPEQFDFGF